MRLSIVICTLDRFNQLQNAIEALLIQLSESEDKLVEILIIDNGSSILTIDYFKHLVDVNSFVRIIYQPILGLSNSRNIGALHAKGDFIFYLDDDCIPEPDMVKKILKSLPDNDMVLWQATGRIIPVFKRPLPRWLNPDWLHSSNRRNKYLQGNLMGFSKGVFRLGYQFDKRLGMKGISQNYGEETLLSNKLAKAGIQLLFLSHVKARHDFTKYTYINKMLYKSFCVGFNWRIVNEKSSKESIISLRTNIGGIFRGIFPFIGCEDANNSHQRIVWALLNFSEIIGKLIGLTRRT